MTFQFDFITNLFQSVFLDIIDSFICIKSITHNNHLPSTQIIGEGEMQNKKGGVIRVEIFIYITAAMLITIFINITAAGWLAIKMAEFMWEKVRRL